MTCTGASVTANKKGMPKQLSITHILKKDDRVRGEALYLAPPSCGFMLLRFTLQLHTRRKSGLPFRKILASNLLPQAIVNGLKA